MVSELAGVVSCLAAVGSCYGGGGQIGWPRVVNLFGGGGQVLGGLHWAQWQAGTVVQDKETSGVGSYDAIRVYLWNALGPAGNGSAAALQDAVRPFGDMISEIGRVPERWSNGNAGIEGQAPVGFYGALLPYYAMTQDDTGLARANAALEKARSNKLYGQPAHYYDQVLILFGKGYADGKYRFDGNGGVVLTWKR